MSTLGQVELRLRALGELVRLDSLQQTVCNRMMGSPSPSQKVETCSEASTEVGHSHLREVGHSYPCALCLFYTSETCVLLHFIACLQGKLFLEIADFHEFIWVCVCMQLAVYSCIHVCL